MYKKRLARKGLWSICKNNAKNICKINVKKHKNILQLYNYHAKYYITLIFSTPHKRGKSNEKDHSKQERHGKTHNK